MCETHTRKHTLSRKLPKSSKMQSGLNTTDSIQRITHKDTETQRIPEQTPNQWQELGLETQSPILQDSASIQNVPGASRTRMAVLKIF